MLAVFSAAGFLVHTPLGPRKSGMPDSVEMPAPVSTTTWRAAEPARDRSEVNGAGLVHARRSVTRGSTSRSTSR